VIKQCTDSVYFNFIVGFVLQKSVVIKTHRVAELMPRHWKLCKQWCIVYV